MHFATLNFIGLLSLALTISVCSAQNYCGVLGNVSQVVCTSFNQFKLGIPNDETIYSCPAGTFCANVPEICTKNVGPACTIVKHCAKCLPDTASTCVDSKKYVSCENGQLAEFEKYCQASKPYCSMRYNATGILNAVCTNLIEDTACDGSGTEPTDPPTPKPTDPPTPEPTEPPTTEPCTPPTEPTPDPDTCDKQNKVTISADVNCHSCQVGISVTMQPKKCGHKEMAGNH